jgi:acetolactate synthase-1/2/3 large subunit
MRAPAYRPVASADTIDAAADLLRRARRPVIVAGGGVHGSGATAQLLALAERIDAAVVTSFSGKGAIAESDGRAAGVLNPLGTTESLEVARRADVILFAGCKVGQNTSHNWTLPLRGQATIQLDVDAAELGRTFGPSVALNGDARATLEAIVTRVRRAARPQWVDEVAAFNDPDPAPFDHARARLAVGS